MFVGIERPVGGASAQASARVAVYESARRRRRRRRGAGVGASVGFLRREVVSVFLGWGGVSSWAASWEERARAVAGASPRDHQRGGACYPPARARRLGRDGLQRSCTTGDRRHLARRAL